MPLWHNELQSGLLSSWIFDFTRLGRYHSLLAINVFPMIKRIRKRIKRIIAHKRDKAFLSTLTHEDQDLIARILEKNLTYLSTRKMASIASSCRLIENSQLPGIFLEAGCALGGSSILIASLKNDRRSLLIYDVFGMIPSPTEEDTQDVHDRYSTIVKGKSKGLGTDKYYGYEENLFEVVQSNLENFKINCDRQSVSLVRGLVQDTLEIDQPVAFAHVDVDWYEPVRTCLERIFPVLVPGGIIILDDYHDWGGCRKATDEYLQKVAGQFILDDTAGSMKITKK